VDLALVHSLWTVLLVVAFLGIVAWAWSSKQRSKFDKAARMPLEDEENGESRHG
jgi:cytochrome c oxidase cbb3-type subunit 4